MSRAAPDLIRSLSPGLEAPGRARNAAVALFAAFVVCLFGGSAFAWETPERGSALRSELLGAVRSLVAYDLSAPVQFVVNEMRHDDGLAFAILEPQRPGGVPIPWESTRAAAMGDSLDMYDGLTTHVFFERLDGHWYVREYSIGATDVWWVAPQICNLYQSIIPEYCQ